MEFNQENFDKLLKTAEEVENYKKAVVEERSKRKTAQEEADKMKADLEELQTFKKDLEDKEAKKKGKYEDLIAEKDTQIKELTEKIGGIEAKATKYDELLNKSIEEKLAKIPVEKQEFVKKTLEGKSHDEQHSMLDVFVEDYEKGDFKAKPINDGAYPKDKSKFEEAKKKGDTIGMIANAPELTSGE